MLRFLPGLLLGAALAASAVPAMAQDFWRTLIPPFQQRQPAPPRTQKAAPPRLPAPAEPKQQEVKLPEVPPAYEGEMARLAEILGALHYLRPLCGSGDGSRWRSEMGALIEAEQPPPERRDRMVASFNRSYTAYEQTYRSCTPAAELAISRFIDEGTRLSREIATRYGN